MALGLAAMSPVLMVGSLTPLLPLLFICLLCAISCLWDDFVLDRKGILCRSLLFVPTRIAWDEAQRLRVRRSWGGRAVMLFAGPKRITLYERYEHSPAILRMVLERVGDQCRVAPEVRALDWRPKTPTPGPWSRAARVAAIAVGLVAAVCIIFGLVRCHFTGGVCLWATVGCALGVLAASLAMGVAWRFAPSCLPAQFSASGGLGVLLMLGVLSAWSGYVGDVARLNQSCLFGLAAVAGLLLLVHRAQGGVARVRLALATALGLALLSLAGVRVLPTQPGTWLARMRGVRQLSLCTFGGNTGEHLIGATYSAHSPKGRVLELVYTNPRDGARRVFTRPCLGADFVQLGPQASVLIRAWGRDLAHEYWLASPTLQTPPQLLDLGDRLERFEPFASSPDGRTLLLVSSTPGTNRIALLATHTSEARVIDMPAGRRALGWSGPEALWVSSQLGKDGQVVTESDDPTRVVLERLDLDTGKLREALRSGKPCLSVRLTRQPGVLIVETEDSIHVMDGPAGRVFGWPEDLPLSEWKQPTLPDRPVALVATRFPTGGIHRFDWRTGARRVLWRAPADAWVSDASVSPGGKHVAVAVDRRRFWGIEHSHHLVVLSSSAEAPQPRWIPLHGLLTSTHFAGVEFLNDDIWLDDDHVLLRAERHDWSAYTPTLDYREPLETIDLSAVSIGR